MIKFLEYTTKHYDKLLIRFGEHIWLVGITLIVSIFLAFLLSILIMDKKAVSRWVMRIWGMIYSIPSLAFFALLIPFTGLGSRTAIVVLVIYNQYILVRSFVEGFHSVEPQILEAARGMGMTKWQIFTRVQFPLSLPSVVAGIHIAIISTIGIATIGATIGAGGLGSILFDGMRTKNSVKIIWGTLLSILLVQAANAVLKKAEKLIRERIRS